MKESNPEPCIANSNPALNSLTSSTKAKIFRVNNKKSSNTLSDFEKEASNIFFLPISCQENISGNYDNYIKPALNHISSLRNLPFEKVLKDKDISLNNQEEKEIIKDVVNSNKKLVLLDLDETLIHAEYPIIEENIDKYDTIIRFKIDNDPDNEYQELGLYLRNGVRKFLSLLNNYFNLAIFTASDKDYANAIIRYLDPNKTIFKFGLYRYDCVNVNDLICIKDLRIIENIDMKKIILIDNNIYSFANQLNNGILINSFYGDKNDVELFNVLGYLFKYILLADDVRKVNEKFFGFEKICKQYSE